MHALHRNTLRATLVVASLLLSACTADKDAFTGPGVDPDAATFSNVSSALQSACASCHGASSGRNFLVTMDSATLVSSGFIDPAAPALSLIIRKARGNSHGGGNVSAFSTRDSALVSAWIGGLGAVGPAATDVAVAVAYDASHVAFRFTWKSQPKTMPSGLANVGQQYPMVFHDLMRYSGAAFARLADGTRVEEDRVSFMIQPAGGSATGFGGAGCYTACHTGMAAHKLLNTATLDHWHWRGGRSGPMGYAEDAAVNQVERIRDAGSASASKWTRSGGDRLREDQVPLAGTGHATAEGMPRFVFNKGKTMPGGFVIPRYFLWTTTGATMTDPYTQAIAFDDPSVNRSLIVAYQDLAFDAVNKVNGLDVGYLVFVANRGVAHLPTHLRDTTSADHLTWRNYWAAQSGVAGTDSPAAEARLTELNAEFVASSQQALVPRSIGFIYNSDQHDVTSSAAWDPLAKEWRVTLYRQMYSASANDANLADLPAGLNFEMAFAMHDVGGGSASHNISLPYVVGTAPSADIRAVQVANVRSANWGSITAMRTNWVHNDYKVTLDWLKSPAHPGAAAVGVQRCQSCHTSGGTGRILTP